MSEAFKSCSNLGDLPVDERLNYVFGQVLGVQDFRQEQVYFLDKNRLHNRSLHGYGTVWGLEVKVDGAGEALDIQVAPGLAVSAAALACSGVMVDRPASAADSSASLTPSYWASLTWIEEP